MNREQYLLGRLAEECNEIAQVALKAQAFGKTSYHPDTGITNDEYLKLESNDLFAIMKMLNDEFGYHITKDEQLVSKKIDKVNKFIKFSQDCGMTEKEP